jgi:methionyl-tRNA formyltransferase
MRVVFMGTPDFAVPTLRAVLEAGHEIAAVYTQPPRPAGRGLAARKSPVHVLAEEKGLEVRTPERLKGDDEQTLLRDLRAEVAVVVAYGMLLPKPILEAPRFGCLNLHASLLPRWRGAAPIQRAILAGDKETGVGIMRIGEGLDTGPVCLEERVSIGPDETAGELHDRLARDGARLMTEALALLTHGSIACREQQGQPSYAKKIEPSETRIDWSRPAAEVHNLIRGLSPYPGAWFEVRVGDNKERVRALRTTLVEGEGEPGAVLDDRLTIACGERAVRLLELQRAGKKPMPAADFLRGMPLRQGAKLL